VADVKFGGPGAWRKGGGVIGGGFGVAGAAEGMLVATALNALTTRTGVTPVVRLGAGERMAGFWQHDQFTPGQLTIEFSWIQARPRRSTDGRNNQTLRQQLAKNQLS
jgi:hypothetical protein